MLHKDIKIGRQNLEWFQSQKSGTKLALLSHTIDIMRLVLNSFMESGAEAYCGKRYKHVKKGSRRYGRWGFNPGSVKIGDEKVPIEVPRIMDHEKKANIEFSPYKEIRDIPAPDEQFMSRLILGISQNDYESARTTTKPRICFKNAVFAPLFLPDLRLFFKKLLTFLLR